MDNQILLEGGWAYLGWPGLTEVAIHGARRGRSILVECMRVAPRTEPGVAVEIQHPGPPGVGLDQQIIHRRLAPPLCPGTDAENKR